MSTATTARINLRAARTAMVAAGLPPRAVDRWQPLAAAVAPVAAGSPPTLRIDGPIISATDAQFERIFFGEELGISPGAVADFLADADGQDVVFMINSPGGSVAAAADICSQMDLYAGQVTCRIVGDACSAASVVAAVGDRVEVGSLSMVMIHAPWCVAAGNANELRKLADMLDKHGETFLETYARRMDRDAIAAMLADGEDHWLTSAELLESGWADGKFEKPAKAKSAPDASADPDASAATAPPATAATGGATATKITITGAATADPVIDDSPAGKDATGDVGEPTAGQPPAGTTGGDPPRLTLLQELTLLDPTPQEASHGPNIR